MVTHSARVEDLAPGKACWTAGQIWTTPNLRGWKEVINAHAIQPMEQFAYTTGKNAIDSALIIDAMDLLCAGNLVSR